MNYKSVDDLKRYISKSDFISKNSYIIHSKNNIQVKINVFQMKYENYYIDSPGLIYLCLDANTPNYCFVDFLIDDKSLKDKWKYSLQLSSITIEKIRMIFSYVFNTFSNITSIFIKDNYIDNKPHNCEFIPPFYFDFFYFGKTWYSTHLNAEIHIETYREIIDKTQYDKIYKIRLIEDDNRFLIFEKLSKNYQIVEYFHNKFFNSSSNIRDFFDKIKSEEPDIDKLYEKLRPWIRYYIDIIVLDLSVLGLHISPLYSISRLKYKDNIIKNIEKISYINNPDIICLNDILIKYE